MALSTQFRLYRTFKGELVELEGMESKKIDEACKKGKKEKVKDTK